MSANSLSAQKFPVILCAVFVFLVGVGWAGIAPIRATEPTKTATGTSQSNSIPQQGFVTPGPGEVNGAPKVSSTAGIAVLEVIDKKSGNLTADEQKKYMDYFGKDLEEKRKEYPGLAEGDISLHFKKLQKSDGTWVPTVIGQVEKAKNLTSVNSVSIQIQKGDRLYPVMKDGKQVLEFAIGVPTGVDAQRFVEVTTDDVGTVKKFFGIDVKEGEIIVVAVNGKKEALGVLKASTGEFVEIQLQDGQYVPVIFKRFAEVPEAKPMEISVSIKPWIEANEKKPGTVEYSTNSAYQKELNIVENDKVYPVAVRAMVKEGSIAIPVEVRVDKLLVPKTWDLSKPRKESQAVNDMMSDAWISYFDYLDQSNGGPGLEVRIKKANETGDPKLLDIKYLQPLSINNGKSVPSSAYEKSLHLGRKLKIVIVERSTPIGIGATWKGISLQAGSYLINMPDGSQTILIEDYSKAADVMKMYPMGLDTMRLSRGKGAIWEQILTNGASEVRAKNPPAHADVHL